MSKLHFFFGLDVLNHLLNIEVEMTDCRAEFTFDLIEIPFWMEYSAIGNNIDLKAYKRGELYSRDPESSIEAGFLSVDKESGEGSGQVSHPILNQCFSGVLHSNSY